MCRCRCDLCTGAEWGGALPDAELGPPLDSTPRCATDAAAALLRCPVALCGSFGPGPKGTLSPCDWPLSK